MATKIVSSERLALNPVSINMTFTTPEQLQAFVEIMGNEGHIASTLINHCVGYESTQIDEIAEAIHGMIDFDTWEELRNLVYGTKPA